MARTKDERAYHRREIARYRLQGYSQTWIAEKLGISQPTVSRDLKMVHKAWQDSALVDFDKAQARELNRIDRLENEYWKAWERSMEQHTEHTQKVKAISGKRSDYEINEKGILEKKDVPTKPEPIEVRRSTKEVDRDGNPAFLNGIERCIRLRIKIYGFDKREGDQDTGQAEKIAAAIDAVAEKHDLSKYDEEIEDQ